MEAKGAHAGKGDRLIVTGHRVGEDQRTAIVLEVLGEGEHTHYRVRWEDDGHESIYMPSSDARFERAHGRS